MAAPPGGQPGVPLLLRRLGTPARWGSGGGDGLRWSADRRPGCTVSTPESADVSEFRLCILMRPSAFPFVISNVPTPLGGPDHRIGRRVVRTARRHSVPSYPAFKDGPPRDSGTTRGHVTGEFSEPSARRGLGPCPSISQVPAALGRRCDAVCRAGLLAVVDIHPAGDRGPSRLAGAAGAVHGEDLPLTGNVFEALLAIGPQVDG